MCVDKNNRDPTKLYSWDEVRRHNKEDDKWIVIDHKVYDVTEWSTIHPGGRRILNHFAGQDATTASKMFHINLPPVEKQMRSICVGSLRPEDRTQSAIDKDFQLLKNKLWKMGMFESNLFYIGLYLVHLIGIEVLAYTVLAYFGSQNWLPFLLAASLFGTVLVHCSWIGHDFGHRAVWRNKKWDHIGELIIINFIKMHKDPDIKIDVLFVVGDVMPGEIAKKRKWSLPYNLQDKYIYIFTALLSSTYIVFMNVRHLILKKKWGNLFWMAAFYVRLYFIYGPLFDSILHLFLFYFVARGVESTWFFWVSQANHITMEIKHDRKESWMETQMHATCNIEGTWFNTWFTGHLNYQIEHHLFPNMPQNNLHKITPYVKELCKKHNIPYKVTPLLAAWAELLSSIRKSGELWLKEYRLNHK